MNIDSKTDQNYNIVMCMRNSRTGYSGGRYHGWLMAEALAAGGHHVTVWTNNIPGFINDFKDYPRHQSIDLLCTEDFKEQPPGPFDIVILIPHIGETLSDVFHKSVLLKYVNEAKLVLLNFESPNWFNELSPEKRDPALWNDWKQASVAADMILSSSIEGNRYAKAFYTDVPSHTLFRHCYPSINSIVADRVASRSEEKQIISFTRFGKGNHHKGGLELLKAMAPAITGCELVIVVGSGSIDSEIEERFHHFAGGLNVSVRFMYNLSDKEKFREIKKSKLMLFLSFFEGFGYPPIESIYSGVPCVAYDLPVLKETCGDMLYYVRPGDETGLRNTVADLLHNKPEDTAARRARIASVAVFENYRQNINAIIAQLFATSNRPLSAEPPYKLFSDWYWRLFHDLKKIELDYEIEKYQHRLAKSKLLKVQSELGKLRKDPIVKFRLAAGQKAKKILPENISRKLQKTYEKNK